MEPACCATFGHVMSATINAQDNTLDERQNLHLSDWFFLLAFPMLRPLKFPPKQQSVSFMQWP
jgi:hypothetical protein